MFSSKWGGQKQDKTKMKEQKWEFKPGKTKCHDCGKLFEKGEELSVYDLGEKGVFYKCNKCYQANHQLANFQKTEVYSRIVGYIRPIDQWNVGKTEEYKDRMEFVCEGK